MSQQDPDGYTLGCISVPTVLLGATLYDTQYSMENLTKIGIPSAAYFAFVGSDGRWSGIEEFAEYATSADTLRVGTVGRGGSNHFLAIATLDALGVDVQNNVTSVPFDSGPEIGTAVARGDVDVGTPGETGIQGLVEEDRIDILYVARPSPSELFPDAPVLEDASNTLGTELPLIALELGVFGPEGIPSERTEILSNAIVEATEMDEYQEWAGNQGLAVSGAGSQELSERIEALQSRAQRYQELVDTS
jgi:tripartite-type tricarboxylate transporter receptor subunit TctC